MVDQFLASVYDKPVGDGPGDPWCMAFASWVGSMTGRVFGFAWPLPLSASCALTGEYADKRGHLRTEPAIGALMLVWHDNAKPPRLAHACFVTGFEADGRAKTIEGNSNANGSREGDGVYAREGKLARTIKPKDRFVWWWELVSA